MDRSEDDFARVQVSRHETHEKVRGRDEPRVDDVYPAPDDLPGPLSHRVAGRRITASNLATTSESGESSSFIEFRVRSSGDTALRLMTRAFSIACATLH